MPCVGLNNWLSHADGADEREMQRDGRGRAGGEVREQKCNEYAISV